MENQASEMLKILLIVSQMYAGFKPSKNASSASNTITTKSSGSERKPQQEIKSFT
jgi:hypothetical protein